MKKREFDDTKNYFVRGLKLNSTEIGRVKG